MHLFTEILGSCETPAIAAALHRLEHDGAVDALMVPREDLARRRLRARTVTGRDVAIALPRDTRLFDGAVLELSDTAALVVRVEAESWLRLTPADSATALALGYHAGNLHWRVRFEGGDLWVALERPEATYRDRLREFVDAGRVAIAVVPENARSEVS